VKTLLVLLGMLTAAASVSAQNSPPFTQCPPVALDTSCGILIVVTDQAVDVYKDPSQGPYDGEEDTLIGVQNDSSGTVYSLSLSSSAQIFGFDGDGICGVNLITGMPWVPRPPACPYGPTGYEGPNTSFSGENSAKTSGVVNFPAGLAPGESTYFSLEEAIQTVTAVSSMRVSATRLSSYSSPSLVGQTVTFVAVVVAPPGDSNVPTGVVTLFDGLTPIGSATLSYGVATIMVSFGTRGDHPIAAQYSGDRNFFGNLSPALTQVVQF
jgi:Bacterial Ig-like domain (group 3)